MFGPNSTSVQIRRYTSADFEEWRRMRTALWPGQTIEDMAAWLARPDADVLVADAGSGRLAGFAEVGTRSYADGCESSPVAYLEGWWVDETFRRQGVGGALIAAAEAWASAGGYRELASDTEVHNVISQMAHARLGFTEVERAVLYRKTLRAQGQKDAQEGL
jgi:aminoglycoside 6'-N-acetyltransferase I